MKATYLTQRQAKAFVTEHHRHHTAPRGDIYRVGLEDNDGQLIGVVMVGRPLARGFDYHKVCEVLRLCVLPGKKNACTFLLARAARIAREMGFEKIITYILDEENGSSLKAAGWLIDGSVKGRSWSSQTRIRFDPNPTTDKTRYVKHL